MKIFPRRRMASFFAAAISFVAVNSAVPGDVFTPVIGSILSPEAYPVRGTDNSYHVVYELQLTNTR
jgi:hypothetical protein